MKTLISSQFRRTCIYTCAIASLLGAASASLRASVVTYTSASDFTNSLASGTYYENFSSYSGRTVNSPQTFSFGGYGFTLRDNGAFPIYYSTGAGSQGSVFASAANAGDTFTLTFTSGVTAIGGNFFLADINFNPIAGASVTATLSDGTMLTLGSSATYSTEPFGGFSSTTPITSLTLSAPVTTSNGTFAFLSLDNVYVGRSLSSVPEPSTWGMMAIGAGLLSYVIKRRRTA